MKLVSVVTVNFNHPDVTEALLQSIERKNTYHLVEVIVVDNGSKKNPVPAWQMQYPLVNFIRSEKNLGFAAGNNLGIKEAKGDYLFLINNDTEITEELIATLVSYMEKHPDAGIVSPRINYFDKPEILQYAGYTPMNYYTARTECIGQFEEDKGQYSHLTGKTGYAHGAAMMVRREALEAAGLMAENFFLYYEELDWCERIKKAGYEVHIVMQALIYHKESMSVGKQSALKEYFMNRNRILFIRRNAPAVKQWIFGCYFILVVFPRNILQYLRHRNFRFITALFKAVTWNMNHSVDSRELGYPVG
ncbi:MAG TPA: glycosyltransferase family 2 protein [Flavipsychrobacter sp.]|nr:glycosyltransferase family 2 protein [Flavipsychrobacter sp.]